MRRADWPSALRGVLRASVRRRPAWGAFDCCTLADDALEAMTGLSIMRESQLRGAYSDWRGAVAALRRAGAASVGDVLSRYLEEVPLGLASRGDLVSTGPLTVSICLGEELAGVSMSRGLCLVPAAGSGGRAWRA